MNLLDLASRMAAAGSDRDAGEILAHHQWSMFNTQLLWALAGSEQDNVLAAWLRRMIAHSSEVFYANGVQITPASFSAAWQDLMQSLRDLGVLSSASLLDLLHLNGFACSGVGGYFGAEAQRYVLDLCAGVRDNALSFESAFAAVALQLSHDQPLANHLGNHLRGILGPAVPVHASGGSDVPPPRPATRAARWLPQTGRPSSCLGVASLPDGWAHIDAVDLPVELDVRVRTLA